MDFYVLNFYGWEYEFDRLFDVYCGRYEFYENIIFQILI